MDLSMNYPIIKYTNGIKEEILDKVVVEYQLTIVVGGKIIRKILCSPASLNELIAGMLITEKIIHSFDEVEKICIDEQNKIGTVSLTKHSEIMNKDSKISGTKKYDSIKSNYIDIEMKNRSETNSENKKLNYDQILYLFQKFVSYSDVFASTGGVHSCAISNGREILYHQDDISRQNALDKVIGSCLLNGVDMSNKILFTSCRISSEIMDKVINSGIKVLVSKSAPTDVAIELAKNKQVILLGFVRGNKMNVYNA